MLLIPHHLRSHFYKSRSQKPHHNSAKKHINNSVKIRTISQSYFYKTFSIIRTKRKGLFPQ